MRCSQLYLSCKTWFNANWYCIMLKKCYICEKDKDTSLFCNWSEEFYQRCIRCHYKIKMKEYKCIEKKIADEEDEKLKYQIRREHEESLQVTKVERKNKKKKYPKEFSDKRKILLDDARGNDWCTACWTKELLQVHHIDCDKFNNKDENLLVLCFYCHAKEHKHMQNKKPPKWLK